MHLESVLASPRSILQHILQKNPLYVYSEYPGIEDAAKWQELPVCTEMHLTQQWNEYTAP